MMRLFLVCVVAVAVLMFCGGASAGESGPADAQPQVAQDDGASVIVASFDARIWRRPLLVERRVFAYRVLPVRYHVESVEIVRPVRAWSPAILWRPAIRPR
jgi:hypothetical protein